MDAAPSTVDFFRKETEEMFDSDLTKLKLKKDDQNDSIERTAMDAVETEEENMLRLPELYEQIYGARESL
jgi:hypothetical protein